MNTHQCTTNDCLLYVEDDETDVFLLSRAMKKSGFPNPLKVVSNGQEALDYLSGKGHFADRAQHPLPCLLLLDLKMPQLNGLEVLEWVRRQPGLEPLVVVMFTSSHHEPDINRAYRLGVNAFLVKPSDSDELLQIVQFLQSWLRHNQFPLLQPSVPAPLES